MHYHFVGIGGIGMSGLARILLKKGHKVTGSDIKKSPITEALEREGAFIFDQHIKENIKFPDRVIYSTAIAKDNPELDEAFRKNIQIIHRGELLGELLGRGKNYTVAGSHGKTTTTALMGHILTQSGKDPTIINGGIINSTGSNVRAGSNELFMTESDESDGSFLKMPVTSAIVTNIDHEHLNYYRNFEDIIKSFQYFVSNIKEHVILCADDPHLLAMPDLLNINSTTYGFHQSADFRAFNLDPTSEGTYFDVKILGLKEYKRLFLPMLGTHNVQNAVGCIAFAHRLNIDEKTIREALSTFEGVERRFTERGIVNEVTIVDDYAHHPTEICRVIEAAKQKTKGKIITVFQPHRYSRLTHLMDDFSKALCLSDGVILLPVYSAGEANNGIDSMTLFQKIKGEKVSLPLFYLENTQNLADLILPLTNPGDLILCLGAGSITDYAQNLVHELRHAA